MLKNNLTYFKSTYFIIKNLNSYFKYGILNNQLKYCRFNNII